ncbi:MAG: glycosyltransferase family 4 protein [Lachnospiraceae bacterium]|jgi:glycosyltransferase involved in cell wall biosynthesis|nr:glycosyltransferase family 4 protein [Lachnospiraceae bacterium]
MNLKIIYFLDDGQGFGGAANTLLQQAVLMKKVGHQIWLCISNDKGEQIAPEYSAICGRSNIKIIRLPYQISSHPEDLDIISAMQNYPIVRTAVREYAPDLLHSIQINPVVELVSRELRIPHIMNIYQIEESFFSIPYMDIFPSYHICDSWYYANIWKKVLHSDSVCIRTIAEKPSQSTRTKGMGQPDYLVRYCCVGGIFTRKNQLEVIKAFERAICEGVKGKLVFYGYDQGAYAEECKKYLNERKLGKYIEIAGFCSTMEEAYGNADALLCGSTCESYPNVISEALAHGLAVISTPVAGVPEVVRDGFNGYLCDGFSSMDIYEKIMQFDREWRSGRVQEILANADSTYKELHSPESIGSELIKYYNHVLRNSRVTSDITMEGIEESFSEVVRLYNRNINAFIHPELVRLKLWQIYHIKKVLECFTGESERKVFIWGAGRLAKTMVAVIEVFFPFLKLQGFIDKYKEGSLFKLPVYRPEEVLKECDSIIFVGITNGQEEVLQILQESSRIYNQDYFLLTPRIW